jgi:Flp pilus assembly protein TadG
MRRLYKDGSGTVGMMFGLLVIPIAATVGLAVDFGRVYAVNNHTQAALDAAALAAGRVSQLEKVDTVNKASAAADAYFSTAKPSNVVQSSLQFSPNALNTEFKVTATSWVRTPFLGILHALERRDSEAAAPAVCQGNYFGCVKVVTTATAALCPSSACAVGAGGNNSKGESLEISLMLDVTGSMCDPCTKIDDLKAAAKDLVDIVIWDDQSAYTSKIALSPFAPAVNVGSSYFTQLTNKSRSLGQRRQQQQEHPLSLQLHQGRRQRATQLPGQRGPRLRFATLHRQLRQVRGGTHRDGAVLRCSPGGRSLAADLER